VAALVLATARTGELVTNVEQVDLEKFHAQRRKWLVTYLLGRSCDPECRGKIVDVMLSTYGEAQGDYDEVMRRLVQLSRGEAGPALSQLHARLLWCQVDGDDLQMFRDRVLVPALVSALAKPAADRTMLEDLVGLLAMVPEPSASVPADGSGDDEPAPAAGARAGARADPKAGAKPGGAARAVAAAAPVVLPPNVVAWKAMLAAIERSGDKLARTFALRRTTVRRERANPPPMIKRVSFCGAVQAAERSPSDTP
jgi:hypothetical protein